ncbi:MAG: hypothetical protein A2V67_05775 [Deltaproteobacteria bacterium RBG_13_61_14]|nr:MAG: hypothetical protein A2V67_05775 [Deltaproteobacteria bacterium RBG_13_61_14]
MARPWRIQFPGAVYHVTARGNNRQDIFSGPEDRREFLELLGRAASRFGLKVFAFCLMSNHYHLFLCTLQPNLAAAMKWLNGTYTARCNRRHQRSGHLFQGRYKSILVADEAHWLQLSMYLHLNPVRAGIVADPASYEWSSFRDYTRAPSRFAWLRPEEVLAEYGSGEKNQRKHYRKVCLDLAGVEPDFWEQMRGRVVLGPREVLEELTKRYGPAGKHESVPSFRRASRPNLDLPDELARVAELFEVESHALRRRGRNFPARLAAYYHLVEHCGISVSAVAEQMGISSSGVSRGLSKFRKQLAQHRDLRKKVQALKS